MTSHLTRKFLLSDLAVLVAATALGFAGLRFAVGDASELLAEVGESLHAMVSTPVGGSRSAGVVIGCYGLLFTVLCPLCFAWTVAVAALSLRQPRAPLRQLACQPGAVACYSATVAGVPFAASLLVLAVAWAPFPSVDYESIEWKRGLALYFILFPTIAGCTVGGAWLALLLGGNWRAERSWDDRAGRVLGVYWICSIFLLAWAAL